MHTDDATPFDVDAPGADAPGADAPGADAPGADAPDVENADGSDTPASDAPDADPSGSVDDPDIDHENAFQDVIAVDPDDNPTGTVNRLDAHTGDGIRHRAFTCLVFDTEGRILLAQRAPTKRLWDGHWDGTVASHPVEGQTQEAATEQRLEEELGISPDQYDEVRVTDRFEYKRYYPNEGVEWEVCAVLQVTLEDTTLDPDDEEIGGMLWADYEHLHENPALYRQLRLCPWFEIAMRRDFS